MRILDITKILNDTGYTKKKFSEEISVSRPTLDKCIRQFEMERRCGNTKIMIVFSRLTHFDRFTESIIQSEIEFALNAYDEIERIRESYFTQKRDVISEISVQNIIREHSRNQHKSINPIIEHIDDLEGTNRKTDFFENLECKDCNAIGTIRQKGPNGKLKCRLCEAESEPERYGFDDDFKIINTINTSQSNRTPQNSIIKVGDTFQCKVKEIIDHGIFVSFEDKLGFIYKDYYDTEHHMFYLGENLKAKIRKIDGNKYKLTLKGI